MTRPGCSRKIQRAAAAKVAAAQMKSLDMINAWMSRRISG